MDLKTRPLTGKDDALDPSDMESIFAFIEKYTPMDIELTTALFPFIPDYIPAIGDIDAFIKVPVPHCLDEGVLGLEIIDEPCAEQSNATGSLYFSRVTMSTRASTKSNIKSHQYWIQNTLY